MMISGFRIEHRPKPLVFLMKQRRRTQMEYLLLKTRDKAEALKIVGERMDSAEEINVSIQCTDGVHLIEITKPIDEVHESD
jgi:hypothetical protein